MSAAESGLELVRCRNLFAVWGYQGASEMTMPESCDDIRTLAYATLADHRSSFLSRITWQEWCLIGGLLSLLGTFALPALLPSRCGSMQEYVRATVGPNGCVSQAIEVFKKHVGRYPRSLDEVFAIADDDPDREKWDGPYLIDEVVLLDPWNQPFKLLVPGIHNVGEYDLWSTGPNGVDESSDKDSDYGDDVRNWE